MVFKDNPPAFDHVKLDALSRDLIVSILRSDPAERPSMLEIIEHPFFKEPYPEPTGKYSREEVMDKLVRIREEGFNLSLTADVSSAPHDQSTLAE
jgi:serine/threonine protein kinase